jgi:hypothetical protein
LPRNPSEDAQRGTDRHAVAAEGLRHEERRAILLASLPAEDQPLVESWWDFARAVARRFTKVDSAGVEARIALSRGRHGSCDLYICGTNTSGLRELVVADLKNQPPGKARWNLQLADYADGLLGSLGGCTQVTVAIVSRAGVDEHTYEHGEHEALIEQIRRIEDAATAKDARKIPGPACAYCLAASQCEARTAVAVQATALIDPVGAIGALLPEQRTELLDRLILAADRLAEATSAIKAAIRDGSLEVPGYRAIHSARTEWSESARLGVLALAVTDEQRDALTPLVSVAKARQILGKDKDVDRFTEKHPGTPSVRRAKDV